jgi:FkbM family methyltransferase
MAGNRLDLNDNGLARLLRAPSLARLREDLLAQEPPLKNGNLKRIAILGAGPEGIRLADVCQSRGIEIVGAYDGNARKRGAPFAGLSVFPSEALTRLSRDIPIVIASHRVLGGYEALRALGYTAVPLAYLQVAAPERFPPHAFYDGLLEDLFEHREQYARLCRMLADERSRATLDAVIAYRLTLNPLYLRDVVDWNLYGALSLDDDEVYVDCGTYNGDSIQLFSEHVKGKYKKVYGFEPDKATFKVLSARFGDNARVELVNAGVYSSSGALGFVADSSRAAKIDPDSEIKIDVVSLDDRIQEKVTFIKMNIEGAEIEALKGGRSLIGKYAPKLAVSCYHRPTDLWQLPQLVTELNGAYRLYLRQQDGGIIESVIYAVAST